VALYRCGSLLGRGLKRLPSGKKRLGWLKLYRRDALEPPGDLGARRSWLLENPTHTAGPWKLSTSILSLYKEAARAQQGRKRLRNVNHIGPIVERCSTTRAADDSRDWELPMLNQDLKLAAVHDDIARDDVPSESKQDLNSLAIFR
jgi:hypothetical protein